VIVPIKDALDGLISKGIDATRLGEELKVYEAWRSKAPEKLNMNASFENYSDGILYLSVRNSSWAQQVNLQKLQVMAEINSYLGKKTIKDLRIKAGSPDKNDSFVEGKKIVCVNCGVEHWHGLGLCPVCEIERRAKIRYAILRLLTKEPKIEFSDAKEKINGIDETDFKRAKRDLKEIAIDVLLIERRNRGKAKVGRHT
jgi:hypothetical protein